MPNLQKYLQGFQGYEADTICILKFTKGHNYLKIVDQVTLPFSAHCLSTLYIFINFQENISIDFRVISYLHDLQMGKFTKGHNFVKSVGGVVVVLLFYADGKHLRSCRDGQVT